MWKKALALGLSLCFLGTPAMAKWGHKHKRGGHGRTGYTTDRHGYPGRWSPRHHHRGRYSRHYYRHTIDDDVFLWLGLTAVGLRLLDALTYQQRILYEEAHWRAAEAPIGDTITWSDGPVSGAVTPVREGIAGGGEYCREFQREVQIDGRSQRAWGIACLQEDGSWRVTR